MAARRPYITHPRAAEPRLQSPRPPAPRPEPPRPQIQLADDNAFVALGVPTPLCMELAYGGITAPFPIQAATIGDALAGLDVLGRGRTGSGKTLAFLLPMLTRLAAKGDHRTPRRPRALVLVPTRELASQIDAVARPLAARLGLRTTTIFGGVGAQPQIVALAKGVDLVIACPGRLADHLQAGRVHLDAVEITVLDEADHMADLGFLPVVTRLLQQTPSDGQRLLFSATLDGDVDVLVRKFLTNPVLHEVDDDNGAPPDVHHHVLHVQHDERLPILTALAGAPSRTVVFTRTKHAAKRLTQQLVAAGVHAVELHGNLAQAARTRNLAAFSNGSATALVATDIAARGIHVDDVGLVVHADPPIEHKAYLHRSGRTARAGARGTVVTLMTDAQVSDVRDLTAKAGIRPFTTAVRPGHGLIQALADGTDTSAFHAAEPDPAPVRGSQPNPQGRAQGPGRGQGQGQGRRPDGSQPRTDGARRRRRRHTGTTQPTA
jgi:superfamily II DNA/RNA helicase